MHNLALTTVNDEIQAASIQNIVLHRVHVQRLCDSPFTSTTQLLIVPPHLSLPTHPHTHPHPSPPHSLTTPHQCLGDDGSRGGPSEHFNLTRSVQQDIPTGREGRGGEGEGGRRREGGGGREREREGEGGRGRGERREREEKNDRRGK